MDTLIVEATIHYLDLTLNLPAPPAPASALLHVRNVLDGLLGTELTLDWDDVEYALKGTGRVALTAADRDHLGDLALKIPLLGGPQGDGEFGTTKIMFVLGRNVLRLCP